MNALKSSKFFILFFFFLFASAFFASSSFGQDSKSCYLSLTLEDSKDQKQYENILHASTSLISSFIEKVNPPPTEGIRQKDCTYFVSISSLSASPGIFVAISGRKLNAISDSSQTGLAGVQQALLQAIYRNTTSPPKTKNTLCLAYPRLLEKSCQPIQATIHFFDHKGAEIVDHSTVREADQFNIAVKSSSSIYAYLINQDTQGNFFRIFPNPMISSYSNPLRGGHEYFFPPKSSEFILSFDQNIGQENFYFVVSRQPLQDLKVLFEQLEQSSSPSENQRLKREVEQSLKTRGEGKLFKTGGSLEQFLLEGSGEFVKIISLNHIRS